jgi:hypothetical protein
MTGRSRTPQRMKTRLACVLASLLVVSAWAAKTSRLVLLEAEEFKQFGGWVLDQQFMDQMGSAYLLAHGRA